jgi:hypothetical protein
MVGANGLTFSDQLERLEMEAGRLGVSFYLQENLPNIIPSNKPKGFCIGRTMEAKAKAKGH